MARKQSRDLFSRFAATLGMSRETASTVLPALAVIIVAIALWCSNVSPTSSSSSRSTPTKILSRSQDVKPQNIIEHLFAKINIKVFDDNKQALFHYLDNIDNGKLRRSGLTFINFNAHLGLAVPATLHKTDVRDYGYHSKLKYTIDSTSFLTPLVYAGHVNKIVWIHPPWADNQLSEGVYDLIIGNVGATDAVAIEVAPENISEIDYLDYPVPSTSGQPNNSLPIFGVDPSRKYLKNVRRFTLHVVDLVSALERGEDLADAFVANPSRTLVHIDYDYFSTVSTARRTLLSEKEVERLAAEAEAAAHEIADAYGNATQAQHDIVEEVSTVLKDFDKYKVDNTTAKKNLNYIADHLSSLLSEEQLTEMRNLAAVNARNKEWLEKQAQQQLSKAASVKSLFGLTFDKVRSLHQFLALDNYCFTKVKSANNSSAATTSTESLKIDGAEEEDGFETIEQRYVFVLNTVVPILRQLTTLSKDELLQKLRDTGVARRWCSGEEKLVDYLTELRKFISEAEVKLTEVQQQNAKLPWTDVIDLLVKSFFEPDFDASKAVVNELKDHVYLALYRSLLAQGDAASKQLPVNPVAVTISRSLSSLSANSIPLIESKVFETVYDFMIARDEQGSDPDDDDDDDDDDEDEDTSEAAASTTEEAMDTASKSDAGASN